MIEGKYQYYAFISYKREDEQWAKWLQKKLEGYKLPSVIRKESPSLPQYIRPVFRDSTDLSGGVLVDSLHNELVLSKFLIVVCSPNATKSEWVNKEAQTFIDDGRLEQIIPFIVDGTPHAESPADECFPGALLNVPAEKELLGINVQEVGKSMAFVRLIATMFGVRFDALWKRHRREAQKKRIVFAAIAVLIVAAAVFVWDYNRATYKYFADYVDCYGVPEGVIPLTDDQVSHRNGSYQFEYRRIPFGEPNAYQWRLHKVSYVNSALRPKEMRITYLPDDYRNSIQEFEYSERTGMISQINYCDFQGRVKLRHVLYERNEVQACIADLKHALDHKDKAFAEARLNSSFSDDREDPTKSIIVRYVYERDERGFIIRQTFHSNNDDQLSRSAIGDADGIYGRVFKRDSLGRCVQLRYIDANDELTSTGIGIAGQDLEYDAWGNISKQVFINIEGEPVLDEDRVAFYISQSDEYGNVVETSCFAVNGQPCLHKNGMSTVKRQYDKQGNDIERAFFDTKGKPCYDETGVSVQRGNYDSYGRLIESMFFDTQGKPCLDNMGICMVQIKYDRHGNILEKKVFDAERKPCLSKETICSIVKYKWNSQNLCNEESYYDTDGSPCTNFEGIAGFRSEYDDEGNCTRKEAFGIDGSPTLSLGGHARIEFKYNNRGNIIEVSYFDQDGKPCFGEDGCSICRKKHDDAGNVIDVQYYGIDGQKIAGSFGVSHSVMQYDEKGNRTEGWFYDAEDHPCLNADGMAHYKHTFDEYGYLIKEEFFDIEDKRCLCNEGYAIKESQFDKRGLCIETRFLGIDEKPCLNFNGLSRMTAAYDSRCRRIEEASYGCDGLPCKGSQGFAKATIVYDDYDRPIEYAYYDENGHLCLSSEKIAKWTVEYDEHGNETRRACFGADGNPCLSIDGAAILVAKYDARSFRTECAYYGVDGKLCMNNMGYARQVFQYNERGLCVSEEVFDTEGNRCQEVSTGVAGVRKEYDERGLVVKSCYLNTEGEIDYNIEGSAIIKDQYDAKGFLIEKAVFDPMGNPCITNTGIHKITFEYDRQGRLVRKSTYGTEGEPVAPNGYYCMELLMDEKGHQTGMLYYDSNGNIVSNQVQTLAITGCASKDAQEQIPEQSIVLQWNKWVIGMPFYMLELEIMKSRGNKKDICLLTPDQKIVQVHFSEGMMGVYLDPYFMEKTEAKQWVKKLKE